MKEEKQIFSSERLDSLNSVQEIFDLATKTDNVECYFDKFLLKAYLLGLNKGMDVPKNMYEETKDEVKSSISCDYAMAKCEDLGVPPEDFAVDFADAFVDGIEWFVTNKKNW